MSQMSEELRDPDQGQVCPHAKPAPGFKVLHKCELRETQHCARTATDYKIKSDNAVCPARVWSNPDIWQTCEYYRRAQEND